MGIYMFDGEPRTPDPEIVRALIAKTQPEITALFQRHWVSPEEADQLFDEILPILLARWDRLENPATWLVRTVDKAIRARLLIPLFQESDPLAPT
jgi:hypothetical protein